MKLLLLLVVVGALWWLLRRSLRGQFKPPPGPTAPPPSPQAVLACAHCGVHLPADEALPGRGGVFCGEAHRNAYEQAHVER